MNNKTREGIAAAGKLCPALSRLVLGALLLLALPVHAYFGLIQPWLQSEIRTGYVMTRAQVVSPEGNLFLIVEESSNTSGNPVTREVRLVGEVEIGGDLDGFYVLSAADIRYYQNWYKQLRAERGENLMDRAEWLDRDQLAQGIKLANGTVVTDLRLADVTKKVLVLGERDRFGSNPDGWLLMQVPYDPDQVSNLDENVTSLLFDRDGNRLDQTTGSRNGDTYTVQTFTYRTAYFGQGEEAVEQSDKWRPAGTDKIFGPMTSQTVRLYEPSMPVSSTNERGLYSLFWIMPCPFGGILDFTLELELQARSYNPMGSSLLPLLMHHQTSAACSQTSSFFQGPNFYVDLIWMAGQVRFANELNGTPLPIGEELLFDASAPELTRAEYSFDFDGDGTKDTVVQANKKVEDELDPETNEPTGRQFIVPDTEGDPANYQWQAVYFSSGTRDPNAEGPAERQPDLWRVADRNLARDANNELLQAGRLTQISTEAALNTDVYIFRESTGELIVEVSGLPEAGDRRIVDNGRAYTWNTVMRGPRSQMFIGGAVTLGSTYSNQKDPQKFAEDLGISSRFIGRDTGIPGPGETLRIVAINRTTGYTGSATFTLGSPSTGDNVLYSGSINQRVPELTLTPPNLKVWARRIYDIEHGLTQGEKAEYLIGHEGAATRNDTLVAIFTEWLDEYGKPLPEGLGENSGKDFGLSGRLAKLTGNELTPISAGTAVDPDNFDLESIAQGSAVVEFGIKPGRQAQLIRLKADHVSNEHYYVNVFGRAINKEACPHCEYDQTGKNEGILAQRPNHYTPFYVPRYDEATTLALRKERDKLLNEQIATGVPLEERVGKAESQYQWLLRPEYQFSLIELTINELQAIHYETDANGERQEIVRNLLDDSVPPIVSKHDELIRVLYELLLPDSEPLSGFDGPNRQYVLSFGEDEQELTVELGPDGLEFTSIEHLDQLISLSSPSDLLTLRVFLNDDPGNVLWEWAFVKNGLRVEFEHPAEKILLKPRRSQEQPNVQEEGYYTLGGARLRLSYDFPNGSVPRYLSISVNRPGYACKTFHKDRLDGDQDPCVPVFANAPLSGIFNDWKNDNESAGPEVAKDWVVYWEPEDWSTSLDARISVNVGYVQAQKALIQATLKPLPIESVSLDVTKITVEPMESWLRSRQLDPSVTPQQQGGDVAILEAILWQLGLSPQRGADQLSGSLAGSSGARIGSHRGRSRNGTDLGWANTCQGARADRRDTYYAGWTNCPVGHVSLEGMIKRFQARNNRTSNLSGRPQGAHVDGIVGPSTLSTLATVWRHYLEATSAYPVNGGVYADADLEPDHWQQVTALVHQGGLLDYARRNPALPAGDFTLVATYDSVTHDDIVAEFPAAAIGLTFADVFKAWVRQESGGKLWGDTGSDRPAIDTVGRTPYRIHEGSGDEQGSMGFNHIVWKRTYGVENDCNAVRGVTGSSGARVSNVNLYDPVNSVLAFVAAAAHQDCNYSNGLYRAYAEQTQGEHYRVAIPAGERPLRYCYETNAPDQPGQCVANGSLRDFVHTEDRGYQLLGKAVMAYNQGTGNLNSHSYFSTHHRVGLRMAAPLRTAPDASGKTAMKEVYFGYWLAIKDRSWRMFQANEINGYLPYVSYVWAGALHPPGHSQAGQPAWCFAYGEREWRAGEVFALVKERARGDLLAVPPVQPLGRIDCVTGAPV